MKVLYSLLVIAFLLLISLLATKLPFFYGIILPYFALLIFLGGIIANVFKWAKLPVPFREPTVAGQQKSLNWIKANNLESPYNLWGVLGRMFLEIFFFRSLFRNTTTEIKEMKDGPHLIYKQNIFLWLFAIIFHYSFLIILLRHFRFFTDPVLPGIQYLQQLDGLFEIMVPNLFLTNILIFIALAYLLIRRFTNPQVRYISLISDYFALFLILTIVFTGILMRYIYKIDLVIAKEFITSVISFQPALPVNNGVGLIFYIHLFFICVLLIYFPFSKLLHMAGIFFSPTRNLANNNRMKRHINPWNPDVKGHTYQEYEDEFRDLMKGAEFPLDKE